MINYLLKTLFLAVFSFIVIFFYYSSPLHAENFDGYLIYIIIVGIIYGIYKYFQLEFSENKASFSLMKILGFFVLHLAILSVLFFVFNGAGVGAGIILFFKIICYLILPTIIVLISIGFGKKVSGYLPSIQKETEIYKFLISLGIGFFSFVFLLDFLGVLGFYNIYIVLLILIGFFAYSYKQVIEFLKFIYEFRFEVDIEEGSYIKLITGEFLFLVCTLVLGVSLISIVRPFPIGWDDLGVYMNYPHLMAEAGRILPLGAMQAWQTFTGIGYMLGSPTQAFFINNVGGILSVIVLILVVTDLLKSNTTKKIKTSINIPLLVATLFISMPMMVFQQAKDMKVDAGLFFVSVIALYTTYKYYIKLDNTTYLEKIKGFINDKVLHKSFNISNLLVILVIGLLAGFAFSIKFTSLLLISGIIGIIFYTRLGISGLLGYLAVYFAIFTKGNLWASMNVVVNPDKIPGFETKFAMISGIIGLGFLIYSGLKNKQIIKKASLELGVFILGVIIALLPWLGKNFFEVYPNVSISSLLSGKQQTFVFDKTLIHSQQEIDNIDQQKLRESMSSQGVSSNEDLGRYFGYEQGVNNYIKLPWNLTMQVNQSGEFTDIGFFFLALIPVIFMFLPYKRKEYAFLILLILAFELLVYIKPGNTLIPTSNLSGLQQSTIDKIFTYDDTIFQDSVSGKSIFDIDFNKYVSDTDIQRLVTNDFPYQEVKNQAENAFYEELKTKVINEDLSKELVLTSTSLSDEDFSVIQHLREIKKQYSKFNSDIDSIVALDTAIINNSLESEKSLLEKIWKDNRNLNQTISDFFASFSLPLGYSIVLLIFFVPVIFFIYLLDGESKEQKNMVGLFKYNLIFASIYTFLWTISAFGIVWYGITMYFCFLLFIAIGLYYISGYESEENEKEFYIKLFGTLVFSLIILIYIVRSIIPHTFDNLKGASYEKFKTGEYSTDSSVFYYHPEYLKILFYTNIAEDKREEFLKEYISDDIKQLVTGIEKMDIYMINSLLIEIPTKYSNLKVSCDKSLNNLYKYISNPTDKYKNQLGVYRVGTFLSYHISENYKRFLEDSLIFNFSDYIYSQDANETVENLKKLGLGYLLVDLNAATIDKDERHNLTRRYERLLSTLTSDNLELIETDSVCLKIALEQYQKSNKTTEDKANYMTVGGVNYESYTDEGETIPRGAKVIECYKTINSLINDNKIDDQNYTYLLNLSNYISQNKDKFKTDEEIYALLQQQVTSGYKALFKIKY